MKIPADVDPRVGKSFMKEIENWQKLEHENITRLLDYNILPAVYLEIELNDQSMDQIPRPLSPERAAFIILEISRGLKYVHNKGIIHRDLKPSNILLKNDVPKISGWGLSKVKNEIRFTASMSLSPMYAAPEQYSPKTFGKVDERTDIYQLGVILYELVTGELPFTGDTIPQLFARISSAEPVRPSELNHDARSIEPIILKCMNKDKNDRYQSVDEFQHDLAKHMKIEFTESLKQSRGDIKRSNFLSGELCLLCLRTRDFAGALKYATSLKQYARGEIQDRLSELVSDLEFRHQKNMEISEEVIEEAIIIVHQIRMGC